jgi:hypothetical protein
MDLNSFGQPSEKEEGDFIVVVVLVLLFQDIDSFREELF